MLFMFLGHTRAALITALNIPLALMIAFSAWSATGTPANLISLGAVDFGIVVDSTVIMIENIFRHLGLARKGIDARAHPCGSAREVGGADALLDASSSATAFLPLFTMTGVSGVIFSPMAHTYAFAIGGAILLALTLTPVLASQLTAAAGQEEKDSCRHARARPLLHAAVQTSRIEAEARRSPLALVPIVVICDALSRSSAREFMPKLEEGNFWIRATLPTVDRRSSNRRSTSVACAPSSAAARATEASDRLCDEEHRAHPEIETVVSQLGRPDDGTDVSGFYNIELFAPLKPFDEWPRGVTKEKLTDELNEGARRRVPRRHLQLLADDSATTSKRRCRGVKGENSVKVIGPDSASTRRRPTRSST